MPAPPPHLLVAGRVREGDFLEGGKVRIAHVNAALERLGVETTFASATLPGLVGLAARLVRGRAAGVLRRQRARTYYLASNGTPPPPPLLALFRRLARPLLLDVHDDARLQFPDLGIRAAERTLATAGRRLDASLEAFARIGFLHADFAALYDVPPERIVYLPNASDPAHFPPAPLPAQPVVALVGSTSPGRGADLLIEACALARADVPELRLRLALSNIGGRGDLGELQARYREPWISWESVDFRGLPGFLAGASVCAVPLRPSRYADLALPIKLFDSMAAARPVVVTRCRQMARVVEEERCGLVADATTEDLAAKLAVLLADRERSAELGRRGREAVERRYNWERVGDDLVAALRPVLAAAASQPARSSP